MLKQEYNKLLDWLEDFISSGQADEELGEGWEEEDLVKYLKENFREIVMKINTSYNIYFGAYWASLIWEYFYTLVFKKEKYIITNNVLIEPCLSDFKKVDDIPNTVQKIGNNCFNRNRSLTSVTIPEGVTSIGEWAFSECRKLNTIKLPNTLKIIEPQAFSNCYSLINILIPNNVTTIGDYAFEECIKLTSITIGNNITSIGRYVFDYCEKLNNITIPNTLKWIGEGAFYNCANLKTITFTGTKKEWNKIKKEVNWRPDTNKITIHCTDADLEV